jgi:hypothetical protein
MTEERPMGNSFVEIITCQDKISLKRLCRSTTVASEDFVNFIVACKAGATHLNHVMSWTDYVPDALAPREDDWHVLKSDSAIMNSQEGQKALRRLFKSHGQRKYKVGHMFISKELQHPIREWHFIFFEINELYSRNNHWVCGPHVHITNYLWPELYCQQVWEDFIVRKSFPRLKLHLSFIEPSRGGPDKSA